MMNLKTIGIAAVVLVLLAISPRGISQSLNSTGFGLSGNGGGAGLDGWTPSFAVTFGGLAVSSPGGAASHSYAPRDLSTLAGGTFTTAATIAVTDTKVVSATVAAGGNSCMNGAQTVTGTTGTGTKFQALVTVSGNVITAVNSISVAGDYTANPTTLAAEPVTGAGCTGAQLSVVMGALYGQLQQGGIYSATASSPVSESASTGSGTGATWNVSFAPIAPTLSYGSFFTGCGPGAGNGSCNNMALGTGALAALTTGNSNLAIGPHALYANQTGQESTALGISALAAWNPGAGTCNDGNIAIGIAALSAATTGCHNVAIGASSLGGLLTATQNTAVGQNAGGDGTNDIGSNNTAVGYSSLLFGTNARHDNTAIGVSALRGTSGIFTGINNVAIGNFALFGVGITSAQNNVVVGENAVNQNGFTSASQNTVLGASAGQGLTTGQYNFFGGYGAGTGITTTSGNIVIGGLASSNDAGNETIIIGGNGNAGSAGARGAALSVIVGAESGNASLTGTNNTFLGRKLANATCTTANNDLFIGTSGNIDCGTNNHAHAIVIGTQSSMTSAASNSLNLENIFLATGTNTASTSISAIAGAFQVGSTTALTLAGGEVGLAKIAASGSAPGAAGLKFAAVCGTNAGSAKIITYAGTSTTPVTIVDNIGSGVTGC